eukprot:320254-Prorocentrum_minimum.AAC.1
MFRTFPDNKKLDLHFSAALPGQPSDDATVPSDRSYSRDRTVLRAAIGRCCSFMVGPIGRCCSCDPVGGSFRED